MNFRAQLIFVLAFLALIISLSALSYAFRQREVTDSNLATERAGIAKDCQAQVANLNLGPVSTEYNDALWQCVGPREGNLNPGGEE